MSDKNLKIGIIGAGIQGVCNALFLQKKGYQVILLIGMSLAMQHLMGMQDISHLMLQFH